jgi:hypothetical protein
MKLITLLFVLLFFGCKKVDITPAGENDNLRVMRSDDALLPLKCHALSLTSINLVKQLYTNNRVKSLTYVSKDILGLQTKWFLYFAYYPNQARIRGSRGEYYDGVRQGINRDTIEVNFNSYGYATTVYTISASRVRTLQLTLTYNTTNPALIRLTKMNNTTVINDAKGNITSIKTAYGVKYTYNLNSPAGKRHYYSPTVFPFFEDFVLGDYFSLLEMMQWIPMSRNARTSVTTWAGGVENPSHTVNLRNHQYDASGNLVRYSIDNFFDPPFVDNITWHCN